MAPRSVSLSMAPMHGTASVVGSSVAVSGPPAGSPVSRRTLSKRQVGSNGYSKISNIDEDSRIVDEESMLGVSDTICDHQKKPFSDNNNNSISGTTLLHAGGFHDDVHHDHLDDIDACMSGSSDHDSHVPDRSLCHLFGINAFAFAYGLLLSTFGLIVLPVESEKLWPEKHAVLLAFFLGICGVSQLSGPAAGFFSDRCTHRLGKRRPFLLFSSFVCVPSLAVMRWASLSNNLFMYLLAFFAAMLGLNVMYVAYSGALSDLVNENQRGMANGLMGAFTVGGASIGFGCFSYFLTVETGYAFFVVILTLSVLISMITWVEHPLYEDATVRSWTTWTWRDIIEAYWIDHVEHRDFFLVFVSRTLYYMGVSVQTFMLFYFRDVINSEDPQADVAYLALFGQLSGAIFCIPMGILSNRTGRKPLIYLSSAVIILTYCIFMVARSRQMAFIGGAIYGIGNGTYLSVDYALAFDTIPNKENSARYLGIWGIGAFIGTLFGPMLIGPALLYFGSFSGRIDDDGVPMYDVLGYNVILVIANLCLLAGAIVVAPIRSAK